MKKPVKSPDYMGISMKVYDWVGLGILFGMFVMLITFMVLKH